MVDFSVPLLLLVIQASDTTVVLQTGARDPAYSPAGQIAFELKGDLWIAEPEPNARPSETAAYNFTSVTSGPEWDSEPSWTADGTALVFSSDRSGTGSFDLWRVDVQSGRLEQLTSSPEPEGEPTVGRDGRIIFVRGRNSTADLWSLNPGGSPQRLLERSGAQTSPTISPDGQRVAYVSVQNRRRQLRVRTLDGDVDTVVVGDMQVEHPSWSPHGDVLSFTTRGRGRRGGVWITPVDGSYTNLVTRSQAASSWSADGTTLALADLPPAAPGYNGDPARISDRRAGDVIGATGGLWLIETPSLPDAAISEIAIEAVASRGDYNAEAFDRVWERMRDVYYRDQGSEQWDGVRRELRPAAVEAANDSILEEVIYQMMEARPPMRVEASGRAAVSSAHPLATAAGVEMLSLGGNVIDAAVAISFALGVVEPDASGVGGYGEMVLYLTGLEEPVVIEFLTRVPELAGLNNGALLQGGSLPTDGPVLANVPGTVAGMYRAWKEYGSGELTWSQLLQPAIRLAEDGFVLDDAFTTTLSLERDRFTKYESSKELFFPEGSPLQAGEEFHNPDLAWTLEQIADGGAEAFYEGEIAKRLVEDLRGQGNAMTRTDMARYFAAKRDPVVTTYRNHTIYSAAPAASGGASLVAKLNLLESHDRPGLYVDDAPTLHAMIEAWKLAPSMNGRLADPSLWPVDISPATDKESARRRWTQCFRAERSTGPDELRRGGNDDFACTDADEAALSWGEEALPCDWSDDRGCLAQGTTAFAVADADGNFVAVTQTLGTWGGNFYVTPGLGFLYNDKLRSYGTNPSNFGARLPYARHSTSIAPTLVFEGTGDNQRPMLAAGAAGNAWITSAVYQVVAAIIDQGIGPQQALELPRFLVGVRRSGSRVDDIVIQIEDGFAPHVMRELTAMGHKFSRISLRGERRMGYGAAVLIENGQVRAGADPRRSGAAGAIR